MKLTKPKYRFLEIDSSQWTGTEENGNGMYLTLTGNDATREAKLFLRYHYVAKKSKQLTAGRPSVAMSLEQAERLIELMTQYCAQAREAGFA